MGGEQGSQRTAPVANTIHMAYNICRPSPTPTGQNDKFGLVSLDPSLSGMSGLCLNYLLLIHQTVRPHPLPGMTDFQALASEMMLVYQVYPLSGFPNYQALTSASPSWLLGHTDQHDLASVRPD